MSLIHWWPLINDTHDNGTAALNLTTVGSLGFTGAGKIGGTGATFTSNAHALKATDLSTLHSFTKYSMACWVKLTANATNHSSSFLSSGNWNSSASQVCFGLYNPNGNGYTKLLVPNTSDFTGGIGLSTAIALNVWHHYIITYDGTTTKGYIDGTYVGSYSGGGISTTEVTYYYLGAATYYSGFTMKGVMNDFRIYDHTLSLLEINELAKGLVLHYDFEDPYMEPTTNISNYGGISGWNNSGTASWNSNDTSYTDLPVPGCKVLSMTQNTAGQSGGTFGRTAMNVPSKTLTASVWFYSSGPHTSSQSISPYIRSTATDGSIGSLQYNGSSNYKNWPSDQWIRISCTVSTNSSATTIYFCAYTGAANEKFAFTGWQIEEKNHVTPYTKSSRSGEICYDSSGYDNHGIVHGAPPITTDSGCGQYSTTLKTVGDYIELKDHALDTITAGTVTFWAKYTEDNYKMILGANDEGGLYLAARSTANWYSNLGSNTGSLTYYRDGVLANAPLFDSKWHFYAITNVNFVNWIGKKYFLCIYANNPSNSFQFHGQLADFKVFATVLSTAQIKTMYERKAAISKIGEMVTNQFTEVPIHGDNKLNLSHIVGNNDAYVDKATWVGEFINNPDILKLQPSTTYYIRYTVQRMSSQTTYPYTTQVWCYTMLYNGSSTVACVGLDKADYVSMKVGDTRTLYGSFTTPSSLTNWRMVFYSARWAASSDTWNGPAAIDTVRVSDFEVSSVPFTYINENITKQSIVQANTLRENEVQTNLKLKKQGTILSTEFIET